VTKRANKLFPSSVFPDIAFIVNEAIHNDSTLVYK